jgi:hypothetical protein
MTKKIQIQLRNNPSRHPLTVSHHRQLIFPCRFQHYLAISPTKTASPTVSGPDNPAGWANVLPTLTPPSPGVPAQTPQPPSTLCSQTPQIPHPVPPVQPPCARAGPTGPDAGKRAGVRLRPEVRTEIPSDVWAKSGRKLGSRSGCRARSIGARRGRCWCWC